MFGSYGWLGITGTPESKLFLHPSFLCFSLHFSRFNSMIAKSSFKSIVKLTIFQFYCACKVAAVTGPLAIIKTFFLKPKFLASCGAIVIVLTTRLRDIVCLAPTRPPVVRWRANMWGPRKARLRKYAFGKNPIAISKKWSFTRSNPH